MLALVRRLRAAGVRVHLATNQRAERAELMLGPVGYAREFDGFYISHAVGFIKPDPARSTRSAPRCGGSSPKTGSPSDLRVARLAP